MKISRTVKTALALAALTPCWAAASPGDDDPLISAFNTARVAVVATPIEIGLPLGIEGARQFPSAPDAAWQAILENVKAHGQKYEGLGDVSYLIQDVHSDPNVSHTEDLVRVLGSIDDKGNFNAIAVRFVSQDVKFDAKTGQGLVDGWIFTANLAGGVEEVERATCVISPDGGTSMPQRWAVAASDPAVAAKYSAAIKQWSQWKPKTR